MDNISAAMVRVSGRVQGVFFRASARDVALSLGLTGWVKNTPDGSVEMLIEGGTGDIRKMIDWCHHGPPSASVVDVAVEWVRPLGSEGFRISF